MKADNFITEESTMTYATNTCAGTDHSFPPLPALNPHSENDALRALLKRCPATTYYAARLFRQTGDRRHLPAIILGIMEKYVEPGLRPKLKEPHDDLQLSADLGIDSLTMMEMVILVEEVLAISIENEELHHLRTLGEVRQFIAGKLPQPFTRP